MTPRCWVVHKDGVYPFHAGLWGPFDTKEDAITFAKDLKPDGYHDIRAAKMTHEGTAGDDEHRSEDDLESVTVWDLNNGWLL